MKEAATDSAPVAASETAVETPAVDKVAAPTLPEAWGRLQGWLNRQIPPDAGPAVWLQLLHTRMTSDRIASLTVLAMAVLMFIPRLGSLGLWDPWETHYGEVAREMLVRDDFLYPHWEHAYFWSKPALPMWLMAAGMWLFGAESAPLRESLGSWTVWGVRLPFALIAIGATWAVYRIGKHLKDRATGVLCALVLLTSAQFIFIGKQAMVDMPFVGLMTIGLALFISATFDEQEDRPATFRETALALTVLTVALAPQIVIIVRDLSPTLSYNPVKLFRFAPLWGQAAALAAGAYMVLGLGLFVARLVLLTRRDCLLIGCYVCMGLAALAKGLAVCAVVGPTVVLYMLFALDFDMLRRSKVIWGVAVFLLVGAPWYVAVSLFTGRDDEGKTFFDRFWLHDNFGRVGRGVHGDRPNMGYYLEQLAYGMFPWSAVAPLGLGLAARGRDDEDRPMIKRALLFVLIWAMWSYVFFSFSKTAFHHYILPAVPALAVLVGYWLRWVGEAPADRLKGYVPLLVLMVVAVVARDLINHPQHLVSLFTYKYDREYPRDVNPRRFLEVLVWVSIGAMALFYLAKNKGHALGAFGVMAIVFGTWISHYHFNMLSPHWSQYHLWQTYYDERQAGEPVYAYQLNWRGETFYSRNTVLQVKESGANARIRRLIDEPGREFIITEQSRFHTLKNVLSADKRNKLHILDRSNVKFYLCVVDD